MTDTIQTYNGFRFPVKDVVVLDGIPVVDALLDAGDWTLDKISDSIAYVFKKVTQLLVKVLPFPLDFIVRNLGWIIAGLLCLVVAGFVLKFFG